jgi:16S rRNA (guanine966-N2)-methyltransferase
MTRIISGTARGRSLKLRPGSATRPTADRVREALFSSLEAQVGALAGSRFLDVYAGSGAVGLEARSRGAIAATLIESDRRTADLIRTNARAVGLDGVTVLAANAERLAREIPRQGSFDVAFFDPPYSLSVARVRQVVDHMLSSGWFSDSALVIVERSRRGDEWKWPDGIDAVQSKRYGETLLWYGRVA